MNSTGSQNDLLANWQYRIEQFRAPESLYEIMASFLYLLFLFTNQTCEGFAVTCTNFILDVVAGDSAPRTT